MVLQNTEIDIRIRCATDNWNIAEYKANKTSEMLLDLIIIIYAYVCFGSRSSPYMEINKIWELLQLSVHTIHFLVLYVYLLLHSNRNSKETDIISPKNASKISKILPAPPSRDHVPVTIMWYSIWLIHDEALVLTQFIEA